MEKTSGKSTKVEEEGGMKSKPERTKLVEKLTAGGKSNSHARLGREKSFPCNWRGRELVTAVPRWRMGGEEAISTPRFGLRTSFADNARGEGIKARTGSRIKLISNYIESQKIVGGELNSPAMMDGHAFPSKVEDLITNRFSPSQARGNAMDRTSPLLLPSDVYTRGDGLETQFREMLSAEF